MDSDSKGSSVALKDSRMQLTLYKLHALLDFSSISHEDFDAKVLMDRFSRVLNEDLHINNIQFYFLDEDKGWDLILNTVSDPNHCIALNPPKDLEQYKRSTIISSEESQLLQGFDAIIPIFRDGAPRAYILLGDTNVSSRGLSPIVKHLKFAETLSSICYLSLNNFNLVIKRLHQNDLKHQLEMAGRLQRVLVVSPKRLPRIDGIEYGMYYRPYFEIGGDSFDVKRLSDTQIGFCLADVSGKGIPAALMMASFNAHFRARITAEISMEYLVTVLNDTVNELVEGTDRFITAFIARFDTRTKVLEYINAGQNSPVLRCDSTGAFAYLRSNLVGLGMVENLPYVQAARIQIEEPSTLLCYTDGLVESLSHKVEVYSTALLEEALREHIDAEALVNGIVSKLVEEETAGVREVFDDVSILALHFHPE